MEMLQYHQTLFTLLKKAQNPVFNVHSIEMDTDTLKNDFIDIDAEVEDIPGKIRIATNSLKTKVFGNMTKFLAATSLEPTANLLIFDMQKPISYFDGKTYETFIEKTDNFIVNNAIAFREFQSFLKSQENEIDESIHFVDSFNLDLRKIVLVSLSDKGRVTVTYDKYIPVLDTSVNYMTGLDKFKSCFAEPSNNLPKFLKSALIDTISEVAKEIRFQYLFENLTLIVAKAKINFDVYLNNLSVEKIKRDYDEVKSKFFKDLSDVLNKLTQQIIALPIGISATLLAVDKITENIFYLYFISIALCVTSTYLSLLLRSQFQDLNHLKKLFELDYKLLIGNNFFTKYPDEKTIFNEVQVRFKSKISFLRGISESYFWILNLSSVSIICFIIQKLYGRTSATLLVALAMMIIVTFFRNYVRNEADELN